MNNLSSAIACISVIMKTISQYKSYYEMALMKTTLVKPLPETQTHTHTFLNNMDYSNQVDLKI